MNQNDLNEFEILLQTRLNEIRASHDAHRDALPSHQDRHDIESGDWGQALEDEEVEDQIVLGDEYYMEKIQKALQSIKAGTYGKCEGCGLDIPMERLRAKPSVSLCLACQEEKETEV